MYELVEIFESLQGEGRNMGRPCVFVRFAGCNLKCPWCDTDVTKRFSASLDELLAELGQYKAKSVILTGSEPTSPSWTSPFCSIAWISALLPLRRTKRHCGCLRWNAASSGGSKTSIGIVEAPMVNTVSSSSFFSSFILSLL